MKWKALSYLPLAFLAGTHGFALFAPYAAVVLTALHVRSVRRQRRRARLDASRLAVSRLAAAPAPSPLPVPAFA